MERCFFFFGSVFPNWIFVVAISEIIKFKRKWFYLKLLWVCWCSLIFGLCRKLGWIKVLGNFVWLYLQMDYLLLGSMIGDTGIVFQLRSLGENFWIWSCFVICFLFCAFWNVLLFSWCGINWLINHIVGVF